jgi:GTP-binding protein
MTEHLTDERDLPTVAVVGRPNVGKSTLVNRVLARREAVVQDVPGVTRDRVAYTAEWAGRAFRLVDTGGWEPDALGLAAAVAMQAEMAVADADVVLFVVDASVGATEVDEAVAKVLQRSGLPVILVANKVDDTAGEAEAASLWSLGVGEPWSTSALHGRGSGDLLDRVLAVLPDAPREHQVRLSPHRRVALVGRPNVGKSSLLNRLAGSERAVVDSVAGTTRDPVDEVVQIGRASYLLVDTAGLRRRVREASGAEYYSALRTEHALDRAECALLLLDVSEPITDQDTRVLSMIEDSGRCLVIVCNKWDTLDEDARWEWERQYERELARVTYAPRVNVSAKTGRSVEKLALAIEEALSGWQTRIPTGQLNQWFSQVTTATPPPGRGGRIPRIKYVTQAASCPPRFVVFATAFLEPAYRRFLERRLREDFGFRGTPVQISVRTGDNDKR